MRLVELAKAIAPELGIYESGIRPGEKIHEQMISAEDARHTFEFDNCYVIVLTAHWWKTRNKDFGGKPVPADFSYNSGTNTQWLSIEDMRNLITEFQDE